MSVPIVVVGSVNADLRATVERHPQPGETVLGGDGTVTPGGKGANQALAAVRAGGRVAMVGAVGRDPNSDAALRLLRSQ
ncbi:MAG: PfkB family carbohydrate kinase, partial [Acidipropionibacterium jensenii]|nr:PfkB family carbohydrate kinase [Acidipropionibacterium jensenii]